MQGGRRRLRELPSIFSGGPLCLLLFLFLDFPRARRRRRRGASAKGSNPFSPGPSPARVFILSILKHLLSRSAGACLSLARPCPGRSPLVLRDVTLNTLFQSGGAEGAAGGAARLERDGAADGSSAIGRQRGLTLGDGPPFPSRRLLYFSFASSACSSFVRLSVAPGDSSYPLLFF